MAPVSRGRIVAMYVVMAIAVAVVMSVVISAGEDEQPQLSIAGGYDSTTPSAVACFGPRFEVKQSGKFVNLDNTRGTLKGKLEYDDGKLTGDAECLDGGKQALTARVADGKMAGRVGGKPFAAELKREVAPAGTPKPRAPDSIAAEDYEISPRSACLGSKIEIEGDGPYHVVARGEEAGELEYEDGAITGAVECSDGSERPIYGEALDRTINLTLLPPGGDPPTLGAAPPAGSERVVAEKQREAGSRFAVFFLAIAVIMLVARLFGMGMAAIGQPRVMGEVIAGICLGPTLLGAVAPEISNWLFPSDIIPFLGVVAQVGLIYYMFLVGLEVDLSQLKGRIGQVAVISNVSVALPMMLGFAVALPIYTIVGPDTKFVAFALFMGVSMSITAFPVLARILVERRMLKRPVGALALACAAIDDVTAWFLIALATAVAVAGSGTDVLETVVLAVAFCLVMGFAIRPMLSRVSGAYDESGRVPGGWIALIFAGVLLSAYATEEIGIALIFGAFVMGLIMPRNAGMTEDVTNRIETFTITLLLPIFFAYTGLRTNMGLLDRSELWIITGVLLVVAMVGKLFGAAIAARITGFKWRESAVIGTLMNTRGLTELIVLNLALEKGVISDALFAMLVIMALVTTLMAGPLLKLIDPKNRFGAPVEEELLEARESSRAEFPALTVPKEAILVAPQSDQALEQLRELAEPLARSEPPREVILARLVRPPRGASARGALQTETHRVDLATEAVERVRHEMIERGIAARAVAFVSSDPGEDLVRLSNEDEVSLLLIDGRRPLLGEGVPRGEVGRVLEEAPCDVGVLVAKEGQSVLPGPEHGVVVPFGGAEHDWAALELGAWLAASVGAPLNLLGAAGQTEDSARVTRMLSDAGVLVQQFSNVVAQPLVVDSGRDGIIEAASKAGLLVVGLSERWRDEGLGETRSAIARSAAAPILFVRRGTRAGALAPRDNVTQFGWSSAGMAPGTGPGLIS